MKQTVADLMMRGRSQGYDPNAGMAIENTKPQFSNERVFTISLVLDASEVEVLDNRAVVEKRVIARSYRDALEKAGFQVKE